MEEIREHNHNVLFHLCFKQMDVQRVNLYTVTMNLIIYMVKALLTRKFDLPKNQQRLIYNGLVINDDKILTIYNVDNSSIILIVKIIRGGARTNATSLLI